MRTGTVIGLIAVAAVAVIAVSGTLVARAYADRPVVESVSPAPGATVNGTTPLRIVLRSVDEVESAVIRIDGEDVSSSATRTPAGYTLSLPALADGPHRATVDLTSSNPIDGASSYAWSFTTDGTAPALTATTAAGWSTTAKITGTSEPDAVVTAVWKDGEVATTADANGAFTLVPVVEDGAVPLTLVAADAAGNETRAGHVMRVDTGRPSVRLGGIDGWVTDTDRPKVYAFVDSASPTKVVAKVNGQDAKVTRMSVGYTIETSKLPQGTSEVELFITNATGKTATRTKEINVDSTEKLTNDLTLAPGAKGDDVANLTRRLRLAKMWKGKLSWEYNAKVERAVREYQRQENLPVDGIARPALISATGDKIVVIISKFVLNLYLDGKFAKQYPIAVGMSAYPTPTGSFVVTEKIENPTWTPPNSPWAAGLEPVPPGATNPLGTRWIGTSAPLVGIHGTPQDWSIGSAASHGCVRMHIPDVEELFTDVAAPGEPRQVCGETVRAIHHRVGVRRKEYTLVEARVRTAVALHALVGARQVAERGVVQHGEPRRRLSEGAGHGEDVARARMAPARCVTAAPEHADREGEARPAGDVTTGDGAVVPRRARAEPRVDRLELGVVALADDHRDKGGKRYGAHRGEVGEVDGQRLPAHVGGCRGRAVEVDALDLGVDGPDQIGRDEGRIVPDSEQEAVGRGRDELGQAGDQRVLARVRRALSPPRLVRHAPSRRLVDLQSDGTLPRPAGTPR